MSASSPDLLNNSSQDENASWSHSASYQHLPDIGMTTPVSPPLRRTFSDLTSPNQSPSPTKEDVAAGKDILRRTSLRSKGRDQPAMTVSRLDVSPDELDKEDAPKPDSQHTSIGVPETRPPEPVARPSKVRSVSGRLVSLARKPWTSNSPSRPGSPSLSKSTISQTSHTEDQSSINSKSQANVDSADPAADPDALPSSRKRTVPKQRPRRPMVAIVHGRGDSVDSPKSPSTHSLRRKNSLEKFSSALNVSTPVLPPMPKAAATATAGALTSSTDPPRKKDELWGVFRALEGDFQK